MPFTNPGPSHNYSSRSGSVKEVDILPILQNRGVGVQLNSSLLMVVGVINSETIKLKESQGMKIILLPYLR